MKVCKKIMCRVRGESNESVYKRFDMELVEMV